MSLQYERTAKRLMPVHVVANNAVVDVGLVQIMRRERLAWVSRGKLLTPAEAFESRRLRRNEMARERRNRL